MKQLIQSVFVSLALVFGTASYAEKPAETKKVCMDKLTKDGKVVTGKDGKPVQDCKEVKIHKKLDGTKVPTK
jgi:hypothetical protein